MSLKILSSIFVIMILQTAFAETVMKSNPKSKEHSDETALKDLMNSQYFKIKPNNQAEIKDLNGFINFTNDTGTINCSFFKDKVPPKAKLILASQSVWISDSGPAKIKVDTTQITDPNRPQSMKLRLYRAKDYIDLNCEFVSRISGSIDSIAQEEAQRAKCEVKGGFFTRYSRKEYDYACDYNLKYADLKRVFTSAGLNFEVRVEPPEIAVMVLGEDKPKLTEVKKKSKRTPSSVKDK